MNIVGVTNISTSVVEDVVSFAINRTGKHFFNVAFKVFFNNAEEGGGNE